MWVESSLVRLYYDDDYYYHHHYHYYCFVLFCFFIIIYNTLKFQLHHNMQKIHLLHMSTLHEYC